MFVRLGKSLLLAGVAFVIIVPRSIAFGRRSPALDGTACSTGLITVASLSLTVIPEFVSGVPP